MQKEKSGGKTILLLDENEMRSFVGSDSFNSGRFHNEGMLQSGDWKFFPKNVNYGTLQYTWERMGIARNAVIKPLRATYDKWLTYSIEEDNDKTIKDINALASELKLQSIYKEAHKWMRLYGWGAVYVGAKDVQSDDDLKEPLEGKNDIAFLKARSPLDFDEGDPFTYVTDENDPRYGEIEFYNFSKWAPKGTTSKNVKIHYSRMIHFSKEYPFGASILLPAFDILLIIKNVDWSAGESYYQNASRLFVLSYDGEPSEDELTQMEADLKDINVASRYIKPKDYEFDTVKGSGQVMNPKLWWEPLLRRFAGEVEIPERILYGMPKGSLSAADVDLKQWYGDIAMEQQSFVEEKLDEFWTIVNDLGILGFEVEDLTYNWVPLFELDQKELAEIWKLRADAGEKLIDGLLPLRRIWEDVFQYDPKELEELEKEMKEAEQPSDSRDVLITVPKRTEDDRDALVKKYQLTGVQEFEGDLIGGTSKTIDSIEKRFLAELNKLLKRSMWEKIKDSLIGTANIDAEIETLERFAKMREDVLPLKMSMSREMIKKGLLPYNFVAHKSGKGFLVEGRFRTPPRKVEGLGVFLDFKMNKGEEALLNSALKAPQLEVFDVAFARSQRILGRPLNPKLADPNAINWLSRGKLLKGSIDTYAIEATKFEVMTGLANGEGSKAIARRLNFVFRDYKRFELDRLARTEVQHAVSEGTLQGFSKEKIKKAEFLALPDACPICQGFDGQVMSLRDASGIITGETHPNCRCIWMEAESEIEA